MLIDIFDVDHGFCALATGDDGTRVMFDCGHSSTGFRPSLHLALSDVRVLQGLVVSHADEDHVSDLPQLQRLVTLHAVTTNETVDSISLRRIKAERGAIGPGVEALLQRRNSFLLAITGGERRPQIPGARISYFRVPYPLVTDVNNLSLVTFIEYGRLRVILPGDLEAVGWSLLLEDPAFREALGRVNVFVASHHGRENGFCEQVFNFCSPELIVISDGPVHFPSQETVNKYGSKASGVYFGTRLRKVLTTRCDGHIRLFEDIGTDTGAWALLTGAALPGPRRHRITPSVW